MHKLGQSLSHRFGVRLVGWGSIGLVLLGVVGCEQQRRTQEDSLASGPKPQNVKRGTRVVVERTAGKFIEAIVLEEQTEHLKLQTADGAQSLRVSRTDVYPIRAEASKAPAGHYAICGVKRLEWLGCRVSKTHENVSFVVTSDANQHQLPSTKVLQVTPLTRMNIEHDFARRERQRHFLRELREAGSPRAPHNWRPAPRERVVARRGDDWYTARVHELEDDGVRVRWRGQNSVEKVAKNHVIPEPPYKSDLKRGDFALVRPHGDSDPWKYVRVRAVSEDFKVEDAKGEVLHVNKTSLIPIRSE